MNNHTIDDLRLCSLEHCAYWEGVPHTCHPRPTVSMGTAEYARKMQRRMELFGTGIPHFMSDRAWLKKGLPLCKDAECFTPVEKRHLLFCLQHRRAEGVYRMKNNIPHEEDIA